MPKSMTKSAMLQRRRKRAIARGGSKRTVKKADKKAVKKPTKRRSHLPPRLI